MAYNVAEQYKDSKISPLGSNFFLYRVVKSTTTNRIVPIIVEEYIKSRIAGGHIALNCLNILYNCLIMIAYYCRHLLHNLRSGSSSGAVES